jgi:mannose-6-phosphate isomerase-like protein (cupin superfamily)
MTALQHVRAGAGDQVPFLGTSMSIKATTEQFTLIEQQAPPGFGTPVHIHDDEDELFYVLSGLIEVTCGDSELTAGAGDVVLLPRAVSHAFTIAGPEPARLLQLTSPGGFDRFAREVASLPAADPEALSAVASRHGYRIVGPPRT